MKYMKLQMKCKCVYFKKILLLYMLAEVEHTIPCIFDQCGVFGSHYRYYHTNSIISFVRVLWECDFKNKMLAGKVVYMCGKVMRKGLKRQID